MANFVLLIAVLFATASFVSYTAAGYGQNWASDVCYAMPARLSKPATDGLCRGRPCWALDPAEIRFGAAWLMRAP